MPPGSHIASSMVNGTCYTLLRRVIVWRSAGVCRRSVGARARPEAGNIEAQPPAAHRPQL
jgi:hypothetical protein